MKNDRLLKALRGETLDRPPLWLMRQAGRYLPEYRATREKAGDFLSLCKTPELACEVTLQPIDRFGFDAAILFSDILTIPDAMGLGLFFSEGEGPQFQKPIRTLEAIHQLPIPDPEKELKYVLDSVRLIKKSLSEKIPLIGFAGSPWTLASYMIEGRSSKDFLYSKALLYSQPDAMQTLLGKLSQSVTEYLSAQVHAGADVVMIFDSWGGILSEKAFLDFGLPSIRSVIAELKKRHPNAPIISFTKGGAPWLSALKTLSCEGLGLDWTISLKTARETLGETRCLQGNLDPTILFTNPRTVRDNALRVLSENGAHGHHIFNLGHGILPKTPIENVEALVETVQSYRYKED